jgi:uncharacterized protein (TIGR00159 family)
MAFYIVLRWAARARALRIAVTITAFYAAALVARRFELIITSWVLQGAALISLALLVVLFQPEIRRALMGIDRKFLSWRSRGVTTQSANQTLADAAFALASQRVGALFVVVREDPVGELVDGGVAMAAEISPGLIDAIFQKSSPLHDGAVLIQSGQIARANAILPLTQRPDVPPRFGTRHRAAMGLAERTDALVIVVSEERGEVTAMRGRSYLEVGSAGELALMLDNATVRVARPVSKRLYDAIVVHWRYKIAAVALASLIWTVATVESGSSVRTINVPVEFRNVPRGLDIASQSATELTVQLRGRTWLLDSINLPRLVARFDLAKANPGMATVHVYPGMLGLPPGVTMVRVTPDAITLRLIRRAPPSTSGS